MSFEFLIAKRYIWSKRRHPFVGIISTVSILGIAVGTAALIVVLAVMNGFDEDLKSRVIGTRAHLVVEKEGAFDRYAGLMEKLKAYSQIHGVSPYIEGQALVQKEEWGTGVIVRGVDPRGERAVSKFFDYLREGTLSDRPNGVVVGKELAQKAGLGVGSEISVLSQAQDKPSRYVVEGIFSSGMYEYDANLIFLNLRNAQNLFGLKGAVSGISVSLENPEAAAAVKKAIQRELRFPYTVRTWMDMNRTLFAALELEKITMFLILALIIFVACLNTAGSLTILVMDKTKDIGVLKALGATPFSLMKIFALAGLLIGGLGAGLGFLIGFGLSAFLKKYPLVELPREIYYIHHLPVKMQAWDTFAVVSVAVALSFLAAFYPARMAGKLDPVKALRYE